MRSFSAHSSASKPPELWTSILLQESSAFQGVFLEQSFPGKPALRLDPNHWLDVAILVSLTGTVKGSFEVAPKGPCDRGLTVQA